MNTNPETIPEEIHLAAVKWSREFHNVAMEILAGAAGLKSHPSQKKVSSLQFLTEDRIKKVATASHYILKSYKAAFLRALIEEYAKLASEREWAAKKLEAEMLRPWWSKSPRLINALKAELNDITNQFKILNGIERLVHTVHPQNNGE